MLEKIETLACYVAPPVARRFATNPAPLTAPISERFLATVMFADVSGFSGLTEKLTRQGPTGVETLTHLINDYFGRMVDIITAHGGEVIRFAGDALLVLWPATTEPLEETTRRAAQCALAIQQHLDAYKIEGNGQLTLRMGIGAGEVMETHVGGIRGRWEMFFAGDPLAQMSAAERQAQPGEIVLAPSAWALIYPWAEGEPLPTGFMRLARLSRPLPPVALPPVPLTPEAEQALRAYIPEAVLTRLDAFQVEWVAELRRISAIFVNLLGLRYAGSDILVQLDHAMQVVQQAFHQFEGTLTQLIMDDKGTILVGAMGLPPLTHEDDPVRAVQVALAIRAALAEAGLACAIGVTTGRAFCGPIGNAARREYTMLGNRVNLAARLMQAAEGRILCDSDTYHAAQQRLPFTSLPAIRVKGVTDPVPVYEPLPPATEGRRNGQAIPLLLAHHLHGASGTRPLVGRTAECATLHQRLADLQAGKSGVILLEGEAGIGKSRLVGEALRLAREAGITSLVGAGDAIECTTPYHAWRPLFNTLFDLDSVTEPEARPAHILARLAAFPDLVRLAPLLDSVLPLELPDNEVTAQLQGQVRADNIHLLLARLLLEPPPNAVLPAEPLLVVIDDAQWLDSASWALLARVHRYHTARARALLLLVTTRPLGEPTPTEYSALRNARNTTYLPLESLSGEEALTLVAQRLGVTALPDAVARLILARAQGNPFFSEELAHSLRDAGLLRIADGVCELAPGVEDLEQLQIPTTIEGVITSRIDRLSPGQQLTLKTASVIGRLFSYRVLHAVYPVEQDRPTLLTFLRDLERLDLTPLDSPEPELAYYFKHIITRDVAYHLMLAVQRRPLHRAIAEWYEQSHSDDLAPHYALLVHHWEQAADPVKTVAYLERAGEQALRDGAYREAIHFFSAALDRAPQAGMAAKDEGQRLALARWQRQLGEAYLGLGNYTAARPVLTEALERLARPVPERQQHLIGGVLRQVGRQLLHRLFPHRFLAQAEESERFLEIARSYEQLGFILYVSSETLLGVYAAFSILNLAERVGPSPELARAYATMIVAASLIPMHPVATFYDRKAREAAQQVNQRATLGYVMWLSSLYHAGVCKWEQAETGAALACSIAEELGNWRQWAEIFPIRAAVAHYRGDYARSEQISQELYHVTHQRDNEVGQLWALTGQAEAALRRGAFAQCESLLREALPLLPYTQEKLEELRSYGLLALACLRQGQAEAAQEAAQRALDLLQSVSPTNFTSLESYCSIVEVFLALYAQCPATDQRARQTLLRAAQQASTALQRYAAIFPIGIAQAALYQGHLEWLRGRRWQATRAWKKSLAAAERYQMPFAQGLAHHALGVHLDPSDPARRVHLTRAREYFETLGTPYELALVLELLDGPTAAG